MPRCEGQVLHDCHAEMLALRAFNRWLVEQCVAMGWEEEEEERESDTRERKGNGEQERRKDKEEADGGIATQLPPDLSVSSIPEELGKLFLQRTGTFPPFRLRPGTAIWLYCTVCPCGDASMENCMALQADATPWPLSPTNPTNAPDPAMPTASPPPPLLSGRAHFSALGTVRRKPARADAPPTLSKSCADKLAVRQATGLLSALTAVLVERTPESWLAGIVVPAREVGVGGGSDGKGQGSDGCARAFRRRLGLSDRGLFSDDDDTLSDNNTHVSPSGNDNDQKNSISASLFRPFSIHPLPDAAADALWPFARPRPLPGSAPDSTPPARISNVSAIWISSQLSPPVNQNPSLKITSRRPPSTSTPNKPAKSEKPSKSKQLATNTREILIGGVRQGTAPFAPNRPRKASAVSRARLWQLVRNFYAPRPSPPPWTGVPGDQLSESEPGTGITTTRAEAKTEKEPEEAAATSVKTKLDTNEDDGVNIDVTAQTRAQAQAQATTAAAALTSPTYGVMKRRLAASLPGLRARLVDRDAARAILGGWPENQGDEEWDVGVLDR